AVETDRPDVRAALRQRAAVAADGAPARRARSRGLGAAEGAALGAVIADRLEPAHTRIIPRRAIASSIASATVRGSARAAGMDQLRWALLRSWRSCPPSD